MISWGPLDLIRYEEAKAGGDWGGDGDERSKDGWEQK